ncbi:diaminopimelate epimerase [Micromonospora sp. NBC_01699]|uniref:diaminopimelate epimerase n=1 Tax=Micromonospora sp. NBC_01699 TaxID=2975984 RepID=UPI002E3022A4|nr:diaminopimelate epimerase [Micromonospora sp. NBC_01699]
MQFTKGHGTGNDFVILADPDGELPLTPALVAALCDRRRGIGADGVLRVIRAAKHPDGAAYAGEAEWFMDYWNSDGSIAEMCGNGVRVFTRYLLDSGLAEPADGGLPVATRSGVVRAVVGPAAVGRMVVADREISVDLGAPRLYGHSTATLTQPIGTDASTGADGSTGSAGPVGSDGLLGSRRLTLAGTAVDCGNPHLVCVLPAGVELSALDLTRAPGFDPDFFPTGVNVEFVTAAEPVAGTDLHVLMRVYERGSAETLSCGSGAVAVAAVALRDAGLTEGVVAVDVPGGRLTITLAPDSAWLAGPALLTAQGTLLP